MYINWQSFWQKKRIDHYLLSVLSVIYFVYTTCRKKCYEWGILKSHKAALPVVIIGNINIGGSGKTPLVIALGELLSKKNISYAVVSKGYGRKNPEKTHILQKTDLAHVVGDEPLLIKTKLNCPVVVADNRLDAIYLIKQKFPEVQLVLLDDGLQHYQLKRDIEIAVVNHQIGFGNGMLLPAGPLREPKSRLNQVDFIVNNGDTNAPYHYQLKAKNWHHIHSNQTCSLNAFANAQKPITIMSGIAHPDAFFDRVKALGITGQFIPYPDHYAFIGTELAFDQTILMTEKDWVKIREFNHQDAWFLEVFAELNKAFINDFMQKIHQLLKIET